MDADWPNEQALSVTLQDMLGHGSPAQPPHVIAVRKWIGVRSADPKYGGDAEILSGLGAQIHGGRFTPRGGARTLYLAGSETTAEAEVEHVRQFYAPPPSGFRSPATQVVRRVEVDAGSILDLRADETLAALGLTVELIRQEWRAENEAGTFAAVQIFGRLVAQAGCQGILTRSVRHMSGEVLTLFLDNLAAGDSVRLADV